MAWTETFTTNNTSSTSSTSLLALNAIPCTWARSNTGINEPPELINPGTGRPYLEASTQSWIAGAMVYLNAGAVTEVLTAGDGPIIGFALTSATGTAGAEIRIMPVNCVDEYKMSLWSGTAASTLFTAAGLLVGQCFDLCNVHITNPDSSTFEGTVINADNDDNARVTITGVVEGPNIYTTSTFVHVYVRFLSAMYDDGVPQFRGIQL
jgi:hypothetical protein